MRTPRAARARAAVGTRVATQRAGASRAKPGRAPCRARWELQGSAMRAASQPWERPQRYLRAPIRRGPRTSERLRAAQTGACLARGNDAEAQALLGLGWH